MVRRMLYPLFLACGLFLAGCYTGPYMQRSSWSGRPDTVAVMTNHDVVAMTKSGVKESVILNMVKRSMPNFNLGPKDVVALSDSGVSENVINAMIKAQDNGPQVKQARRYYYYDPYYSWGWGDPSWYWGLAWDPWYYYPHYYYSWYQPHYYFGLGGGFHSFSHGGTRFYGGMRTGGRHR